MQRLLEIISGLVFCSWAGHDWGDEGVWFEEHDAQQEHPHGWYHCLDCGALKSAKSGKVLR